LTPLLKSLSYQGVLERGFALVLDAKGAPIRATKAIKPGDEMALRFADGTIDAIAKSKSKA
jgi:exodeoxyribonuclease VII large subunit